MLKLENITKEYYVGGNVIRALKGISIDFRKSEFVAVLGHSGCGKTTLLNIIGGLDRYTSGKLTIAGRPTEKFSDNDWDAYRNHSVGFVFQTYNLIPHQTVLANVELALTLSGVSTSDRRRRALEALERVGLKNEAHKKPNQMSGGQMQRVAIARALVNDPEILLADEPTGALDSETSVQIMDILKQIASDRLVIMVTHNPELAAQYATRTVRLSDGLIVSDSDPYDGKDERFEKNADKTKHTTMSFFTALSLSFNNLMTKKGRTLLTAFAGSIGIIGIALILSLSNGINIFIDDIQEETLASYPVSLYAEKADMSGLIESIVGSRTESKNNAEDRVYVSAVMYDLVNSYNNMETTTNDLKSFKAYIEAHREELDEFVSTVQYTYDTPVNIYVKDTEGDYSKADITAVFSAMSEAYSSALSSSLTSSMYSGFSSYGVWEEMLCDEDTGLVGDAVKEQYTLLRGEWPQSKEELVLFLDENNEITDITLYALGLITADEMLQNMAAAAQGKDVEVKQKEYSFDDILNREFRLVLSADCYTDADGDGVWTDIREDEEAFDLVVGSGLTLKITAIVKPNSDNSMVSGSLGYTSALVSYIMEETATREVVKAQQDEANKNFDIFTGLPFEKDAVELTDAEKTEAIRGYFSTASAEEKYNIYLSILSAYSEDDLDAKVDEMMASLTTREALEEMILKNYSGASVSEDVLKEYIAAYSDDELHDMVAKAVFTMLAEQVKTDAEAKINEISSAPSDEELAMIISGFMAKMTDRTTKIGYVYQDYSSKTSLPAEQIMGYLMTLSDSDLDAIVNNLAEDYAKTYYEQNKNLFNSDPYAKVAAAFDEYIAALADEDFPALYDAYMPSGVSDSTLSDNLKTLGVADKDSPASVKFYVSTFEDKDTLSDFISAYNASVDEEKAVSYTDYVGLIMSSVTVIIDAISYVLVAFVSVSLVVSSIMIGIITYISVLERTKEIGILRAIGASRRDISRVFNAETLVIGFGAGLFGVGLSILLIFPINAVIRALSGLTNIGAQLPWQAAVILILISMALTLIAGLFPSRIASRKDPVIALRTE